MSYRNILFDTPGYTMVRRDFKRPAGKQPRYQIHPLLSLSVKNLMLPAEFQTLCVPLKREAASTINISWAKIYSIAALLHKTPLGTGKPSVEVCRHAKQTENFGVKRTTENSTGTIAIEALNSPPVTQQMLGRTDASWACQSKRLPHRQQRCS